MKLNIQLFAEGTMTYDLAGLQEVRDNLTRLYGRYEGALDTIKSEIKSIVDENFGDNSEIKSLLNECLKLIEQTKLDQLDDLDSQAKFVDEVSSNIQSNELTLSGELGAWMSAFTGQIIPNAKAFYTAEGASQGMETVSTSLKEIGKSALNISKSTREAVVEASNILANSGRLVMGVTGKSPQQLVQQGIQMGQSAMSTLMGFAGSGGSVLSGITGALGTGVQLASFLGNIATSVL